MSFIPRSPTKDRAVIISFLIIFACVFILINLSIIFNGYMDDASILQHLKNTYLKGFLHLLPRGVRRHYAYTLAKESEWASGYLTALTRTAQSIHHEVEVSGDTWEDRQRAERRVKNDLASMRSNLSYIEEYAHEFSKELRGQCAVVVGDIVNLLNLLPSTYTVSEDFRGRKFHHVDFNGANTYGVATPFYEKMKQIKPHLEAVVAAGRVEAMAAHESRGDEIKAFTPASIPQKPKVESNAIVPQVSITSMDKKERAAFERAMEKASSLPLIEGERVKRILADSAQAQELARRAKENGEVSFDGHSPEEMVSSIISGNAQRLNNVIAEANAKASTTGAAENLRMLEQFTKNSLRGE